MNTFLNGLKEDANFGYTENGAIKKLTTNSALYDMFAMCGAYRDRSDADCILAFRNAYDEDATYALKCLFYLRDIIGGQGERRFFRVCYADLAKRDAEAARRNLQYIPTFGRYDDLYALVGTPLEKDAFDFIKNQLSLDMKSKTPSLLAKWLKSENTSSAESRKLGKLTREYLGLTSRQYRKILSILRSKINVLEKLMSAGEWDKIEFDKIPSVAGMKYRNAFARHDVERAQAAARTYEDFMKDESTTVNAKALYPYECVNKAMHCNNEIERAAINKYWDNLTDYFNGATFNGIAVVDVSGSMWGTPITVAISLGLYCAEKAPGPFQNHFFTFSSRPQFVKVEGIDFVDKVNRMERADWGMNTNVESVFNKMLEVAVKNGCSQEEIPENVIIISDMEFDSASGYTLDRQETLFERIERKWQINGYKMPKLVFWNVNARSQNIPMRDNGRVTFVSGFSPVIFDCVMKGKTGQELMYEKLDEERYSCIK